MEVVDSDVDVVDRDEQDSLEHDEDETEVVDSDEQDEELDEELTDVVDRELQDELDCDEQDDEDDEELCDEQDELSDEQDELCELLELLELLLCNGNGLSSIVIGSASPSRHRSFLIGITNWPKTTCLPGPATDDVEHEDDEDVGIMSLQAAS